MRKVEAEILLDVPGEAVFNAFLDEVPLRHWWGVERSLVEKKPGGAYCLAWDYSREGIRYVSAGQITTFLPGRQLEISNLVYLNPDHPVLGPTHLNISLYPAYNGCLLRVVQSGYQIGGSWDWYYEAVNNAWPEALKKLKTFLEK